MLLVKIILYCQRNDKIENNSETAGNKAKAYRYLVIKVSDKVSGSEDAVFITLDNAVLFGVFQALFGNGSIFLFTLNADIVAAEFFCRDGRCSRTEKRIKNHIAGIAGGQNDLGNQLFRLMGWLRRIFGH